MAGGCLKKSGNKLASNCLLDCGRDFSGVAGSQHCGLMGKDDAGDFQIQGADAQALAAELEEPVRGVRMPRESRTSNLFVVGLLLSISGRPSLSGRKRDPALPHG